MNKKVIILMFLLSVLFAATAPAPPVIPELQAVSSNEQIILMWDNKAESSIDPLTGYSDFEGYRIYRSTDGGQTWGKSWDRIYDYLGNHVAWKPWAQFDLVEESDSLHCLYSNGYFGESGELCYSNAIPYNALPEQLYSATGNEDIEIDLVDSLVYLPYYIRGNCPIDQEHTLHDSDSPHLVDCYNGGHVTSFDPMARWINLGDNNGLKRQFIDTDVLDGVQYTYAVTAFDIGMVSFQVEQMNMDSNAESDANYCNGNDSYCDDSDFYCNGNDSSCLPNNEICGSLNQTECLDNTNYNLCNGWNVVEYTDSTSCVNASYGWDEKIYISKETCEDAVHEWIEVEYSNKEACEAVDLDGDGLSDHEWIIIYFKPDTTWSSWNPGHFTGLEYGEDLWGFPSFESPKLFESFSDYNVNGICDNEPFTDADSSDTNANGICDEVGDWSSRCPDNANTCKNAVVVEAGYKASNITFPDETPEIEFIFPDTNKAVFNKGNGSRLYNIVNEYDLTGALLRFEINAGLDPNAFGDSSGSFATLNPSLYIYETISLNSIQPDSSWDKYVADLSSDSLQYYLELPGVDYNSTNTDFISIPYYKIEDYKLTYVDDPQYESHWTDWFDGIQFRFDNGPNKLNDVLSLVEIKQIEYSNSLLKNRVSVKMKYNAPIDISKRPMYRYRIDFSNTAGLDTAGYGTGRTCEIDGYPDSIHTLLPFKITNITNGKLVDLDHKDNGIQDGYITYDEAEGGCIATCLSGEICFEGKCVDRVGDDDCSWQHNEVIESTDIVFSNEYLNGMQDKLFDFKISFNWNAYALYHEPEYFGEVFFTTGWNWKEGADYVQSDLVFYNGMLYRSNQAVADSIPPTRWFDKNGDKINDNVWQMLYPWNDGDYIIIEPYGWYQDGDAWFADLSLLGKLDENSADDLKDISVVPNPYIVSSDYFNESPGNHLLRFTRLPSKCTISIYTVSGEFVASLDHDDPFSGNEWWDITNGRGEAIAPGLYIYVVETSGGESKMGKFAIVR